MLCASASLFDSRILNCENLIRRGIEEVITGLTRNQFVDNTTRGFESLPLRQKSRIDRIRLFLSKPQVWYIITL